MGLGTRVQGRIQGVITPTSSMRANSSGRSGLWSELRSTAAPPRHSTQRLSPALATVTKPRRTTAAHAVHPAAVPSLLNGFDVGFQKALKGA